MERRPLGRTGLWVPALGFGCGNTGGLMVRGDADEQRRAVALALEAGVDYFDTAAQYGDGRSEENLGRTLRELGAGGRVAVGTKVRLRGDDAADPAAAVRLSLERSLRRLGREHVDVLTLHNPQGIADGGRSALPVDEVLGAVADGLHRAVAAGLARHAGMSGLGETAALLRSVRSGSFETVQAYVNALNPSAAHAGVTGGGQDFDGLIREAADAGMGVCAIRVLAAGAVAGGAERHPVAGATGSVLAGGATFERDVERSVRALPTLAAESGLEGALELALRFALSVPGVSTVLVGCSDVAQLESALRWAERGPLPEAVVARIVEGAAAAGAGDGSAAAGAPR